MPTRFSLLATSLLLTLLAPCRTQEVTAPCHRTVSMYQLKRISPCELSRLYRAGRATALPCGFLKGTPLFSAGTKKTPRRAKLTGLFWKGKEIRCDGTMINRLLGIKLFVAQVYPGRSWCDGGPSLIMDYRWSARIVRDLRDEVREIGPGLYLGISYFRDCPRPNFWTYFVLETCPRGECTGYPLH